MVGRAGVPDQPGGPAAAQDRAEEGAGAVRVEALGAEAVAQGAAGGVLVGPEAARGGAGREVEHPAPRVEVADVVGEVVHAGE